MGNVPKFDLQSIDGLRRAAINIGPVYRGYFYCPYDSETSEEGLSDEVPVLQLRAADAMPDRWGTPYGLGSSGLVECRERKVQRIKLLQHAWTKVTGTCVFGLQGSVSSHARSSLPQQDPKILASNEESRHRWMLVAWTWFGFVLS
jgi:hypothetical protein